MPNFNRVTFMGHLTADPVAKIVGENALAQFAIASNRRAKKKDGTLLEESCFLDVEAWNKDADLALKYLHKGDPVLIEGRLRQARWQAKDGTEKNKHILVAENIVFINTKDQWDNKPSDVKTMGKPTQEPPKASGPMAATVKQVVQKTACFNRGSIDPNAAKEEISDTAEIDDLPF